MESIGEKPEQFVAEQKTQDADRPIVVRGSSCTEVCQDSRAENITHMPEAADIGVG
jgi:hypothetical protein